MFYDTWVNPATRDYAADASRPGQLSQAPGQGLANAIYLRLMVPLGSWFGDLTLGSKLYLLQRTKDLPRIEVQAQQYAEAALQPLIDSGRASSIQVTASRQGQAPTRWLVLIVNVVDAIGQEQTFEIPVKVI